ncbi:MAG: hypothetical protein H4O13_13720 [Xanthomonadales bacterium]|nr:hypothetical protein [Xanthomonadales bacterium]
MPMQNPTFLNALSVQAEEAFAANSADPLRELMQRCQGRHVRTRLRRLLLRELLLLRHRQDHLPARCAPGEWVLHESPAVRLRLITLAPETRSSRVTEPGSFVLVPLSPVAREDRYRRLETSGEVVNDVFDSRQQLHHADEAALADGCLHWLRPGVETSFDWQVQGPTLCLRIDGPRQRGFVWSFDAATHKAQMMYPARVNAARERLMLDFLLATRHRGAEAFAERLRSAPEYFLRWAATQACNRLAPDRIEELLGAASGDPHPQIAALAQRVQASLEQTRAEA